jgi:predicted small lipoprotein YifL
MPMRQFARRRSAAALLAAFAMVTTGCGQKGALYLPERGGEVVIRPTQTPASDAPAPAAPATPAEPTSPDVNEAREAAKPPAGAPEPTTSPDTSR